MHRLLHDTTLAKLTKLGAQWPAEFKVSYLKFRLKAFIVMSVPSFTMKGCVCVTSFDHYNEPASAVTLN